MTRPNRLYKQLVASYVISTFAEGILLPIYAIFVQQIGGDILEASGAIAVFLIVSGIATVVIHRSQWSQRNRTLLLVGGWILWVAGIAFYYLISSTVTLFLAQVLVALGNAIADPAFDAELDDHTDEAIKSYEWGLFEAFKDILNGVAAIAGGLIAAFLGFRVLIACMIATATLSFLMILFYVRTRNALAPTL
jgi:hypothetical protein